MRIESSAFTHEGWIPKQYSCKGLDVSPPLQWVDVPKGTQSLVLIVDDPDAPMGLWTHWVLFNIAPTQTVLATNASLPAGAISGKNSWGHTGYGGPCPPSGTHRYFFKLYALDTLLTLTALATQQEVLKAIQPHILAEAELMGHFSKD